MEEKSLLLIEKKAQKKGTESLNIEKLSNKYGTCKEFIADK